MNIIYYTLIMRSTSRCYAVLVTGAGTLAIQSLQEGYKKRTCRRRGAQREKIAPLHFVVRFVSFLNHSLLHISLHILKYNFLHQSFSNTLALKMSIT